MSYGKIIDLKKKIKLTQEQGLMVSKEFFRIRQKNALDFNSFVSKYNKKKNEQEASYNRKRLANVAKTNFLKKELEKELEKEEANDDLELSRFFADK